MGPGNSGGRCSAGVGRIPACSGLYPAEEYDLPLSGEWGNVVAGGSGLSALDQLGKDELALAPNRTPDSGLAAVFPSDVGAA